MKKARINVKCEESLKNDIQKQAEKEGMTFSDFVRFILRRETKK